MIGGRNFFGWLAAGALLAFSGAGSAMQVDDTQASGATSNFGGNYESNLTVESTRCLFRNISDGGQGVIQATPSGAALILHLASNLRFSI